MNRTRSIVIALVALVAVGTVIGVASRQRRQSPPNHRAIHAQATEAELVSAEPTYVGRKVCQECHAENFQLHAQHGHASTFARTRDSEIAKKFVGKTFDGGDRYGSYTYQSGEKGLVAQLTSKFGDDPFPLQYAIGSGHKAVTLFSLIPSEEEGTIGIEHRVSWFNSGDELDLTPGHEHKVPVDGAEFFGDTHHDEEMRRCISCHTTTGEIVGQEVVNLTENVNCEKCHGPASEHVRLARNSKNPPPFSVGRDDWNTESELKLCGSCHRMPEDLTIKQLQEYSNIVIRFQPIGLLRSQCYLESDGALRCTTCHNPHATSTATSTAQYVKICINCHLEDSDAHVPCPVSPQQGCIDCHMPALVSVRDVTFHDHWIRVREEE